jgi:hypothetical protein
MPSTVLIEYKPESKSLPKYSSSEFLYLVILVGASTQSQKHLNQISLPQEKDELAAIPLSTKY